MTSTVAVERAYAALVSNDFATALRIVRADDDIDPEASAPTMLAPPTARDTIRCAPTQAQRKRWRQNANRRDAAVLSQAARASGVVPRAPAACCAGKYFHTNDCASLAALDPSTRYATTKGVSR